MKTSFILQGDIAYSTDKDEIITYENGYLICVDGKVEMVLAEEETIPECYVDLPFIDYTQYLIIPGMTDLHVHAPQYTYRGIGMDMELLDWLNIHTFPEEARYENESYARKAYNYFVEDLRKSYTTRAVVFATIHNKSTRILMDDLDDSGIISYVGRVNMDRNGGEHLQEENAEASLKNTLEWLEKIKDKYSNTYPILTPRFIPSCSDELMIGLGKIAKERNLRIQSHLSENPSEVAWVKELVPSSTSYANAYELFGAMGSKENPTIMAHCVYSNEEEMNILKKYDAYVAHCPDSNFNLSSGIAPIHKMLEKGIHVGLGTDVAAGSSLNMLKTILCALHASKMYYRYVDPTSRPLTFEEVFYLATMGGGSYFGKVGSFKKGYEFDAVIVDDTRMQSMRNLSVRERIERMVYSEADCVIRDKYVKGSRIWEHR